MSKYAASIRSAAELTGFVTGEEEDSSASLGAPFEHPATSDQPHSPALDANMANAVRYDRACVHGRLVTTRTPAIARPVRREQI